MRSDLNVEDGATADQTAAEIRTLVGNASDSNVFTDADHSKLDGIESSATADQTITAGSGLTGGGSGDVTLNIGAGTGIDVAADAISVDVSDFMGNGSNNRILTATGADAMTAESNLTFDGSELLVTSAADPILALNKTGGSNAALHFQHAGTAKAYIYSDTNGVLKFGNTTTNPVLTLNTDGSIAIASTIDGRDLATDGSKLDGIESGATADQTASEILTAIKTVDGASSGLDADLLDGQHGSYYLDFGNFVIDNDEIPIAKLASDNVNFGGVTVTLGSSDTTPAFNLSDATSLPIVAGTTGTLSVARGGTGATSLNNLITLGTHTTGNYVATLTAGTGIDLANNSGETASPTVSVDVSDFMTNGSNNRVLTATGTDAMNAESGLTYDGSTLAISGEMDAGLNLIDG